MNVAIFTSTSHLDCSIKVTSIKVTIIEFTLTYRVGNNGEDDLLFNGTGDEQFDVYRGMREVTG